MFVNKENQLRSMDSVTPLSKSFSGNSQFKSHPIPLSLSKLNKNISSTPLGNQNIKRQSRYSKVIPSVPIFHDIDDGAKGGNDFNNMSNTIPISSSFNLLSNEIGSPMSHTKLSSSLHSLLLSPFSTASPISQSISQSSFTAVLTEISEMETTIATLEAKHRAEVLKRQVLETTLLQSMDPPSSFTETNNTETNIAPSLMDELIQVKSERDLYKAKYFAASQDIYALSNETQTLTSLLEQLMSVSQLQSKLDDIQSESSSLINTWITTSESHSIQLESRITELMEYISFLKHNKGDKGEMVSQESFVYQKKFENELKMIKEEHAMMLSFTEDERCVREQFIDELQDKIIQLEAKISTIQVSSLKKEMIDASQSVVSTLQVENDELKQSQFYLESQLSQANAKLVESLQGVSDIQHVLTQTMTQLSDQSKEYQSLYQNYNSVLNLLNHANNDVTDLKLQISTMENVQSVSKTNNENIENELVQLQNKFVVYKQNSELKISTLQSNLEKAEAEVDALDILLGTAHSILQSNREIITTIDTTGAIIKLMDELGQECSGTETTSA